jgi:hypothetical protein
MTRRNRSVGNAGTLSVVVILTLAGCRGEGPELTIAFPSQSSHSARGDTIHFVSELNSNVDPGVVNPGDWHWVSDLDGEIGRGPRIDTPNLRAGEHHITASVRHRLGLSQATVTVFVDSTGKGK